MAYLELRLIPDKSKLEELINKAESIDTSKYTEESVNSLKEKLKEVRDVLDNEEATQEEANKASEELEIALAGLEEKKDNNTDTDNGTDNDNNTGNGGSSGDNSTNNNEINTDTDNNPSNNNDNTNNGNEDNKNTEVGKGNLPETGGTSTFALVGIATLLLGVGGVLRRRK